MAEQTRSSITIAAPAPPIMAVIADFDAYPEWANVKRAETLETGPEGRAASVRFTLDAGMLKDTYVLGYTWSGDAWVSWRLLEEGSMVRGMDGSYTLGERGGSTLVTYELTVDVKLPMIGVLRRKAEKAIVDAALNGLKKRVER